jgi:hypothetical protein
MTEPLKDTGYLDMPIFVREIPAFKRWRPPPKPSRWQKHFELGRQYPAWPDGRKPPPGWVDNNHGWMIVSRVRKGGRQHTNDVMRRDRTDIVTWLDRHCPLERWQTRVHTLPDTWCDRDLYLRFLGTLTPAEHAQDRAERKAIYAKKQGLAAEKRAKRELEARLAARAEQEANQAKARRRR